MNKLIIYITALLSIATISSCLKENTEHAAGTPNLLASLYVVNAAYKDADLKLGQAALSGAHLTTGVVVADASTNNLPKGYVIIQDTWRGLIRGIALILDETTASGFAIGDSLVINLEGKTLTRSEGPLAITGLEADNITRVKSNVAIESRPVNITELLKNFANYENTLVNVTAGVTPFPVNEQFAGNKTLNDGGEANLNLFTEDNASFANEVIAPSATFVGIPVVSKAKEQQLRLRSFDDMVNASGPIYAGYPEDFESPDAAEKGSYAGKSLDLRTGNWRLEQCLLGVTTGRDRIVSGSQAIRFQQNLGTSTPSYLQMNYDLPNGSTKVTFWYGCYYTDASSSFVLEASTDQGGTWTQIGDVISDPLKTSESITPKLATFIMDIQGAVRFRVRKLPLGATSIPTVYNGRLGIDDFSVYENY